MKPKLALVLLALVWPAWGSQADFAGGAPFIPSELTTAGTPASHGAERVSQQPGENSTLLAVLDLDFGMGQLMARQRRQCPPATFMCPNGRCCETGTVCVHGGCCPSGNQQCGASKCYNPSTHICCGASGSACRKGQNCQPTGCCPAGKVECGANGCYNPSTEVCCGSSGETCRRGQTCQPDVCCPTGSVQCGAKGCYNPSTEVCCAVSGKTCNKGQTCQQNGCCPAGSVQCGAKGCYNPSTEVCCAGTGKHCPKGNDCVDGGNSCCPAGKVPCGTSNTCYNPATEKCCPKGVCPKADSCCDKECCKPGASCGRNGRCTAATKTTNGCSTPTPTKPQTKTQTISFVYDPNRQIVAKAGPSAGARIPGTNDAVMMNMCDGIKGFGGGQSMVLTHGGKCFQRRNRRKVCKENGISWCSNALKEYVKKYYPSANNAWVEEAIVAAGDMTCDEFPFASSIEGGDLVNGVRVCVPRDDNNWQGQTMARFFDRKRAGADVIEAGHKYKIEIVGWDCSKQKPVKRSEIWGPTLLESRDAFTNAQGVNRTGVEMYKGFDTHDKKLNLMTMPLGDLGLGSYVTILNITTGALNLSLVDNNGQSFDFVENGGSLSFTLDDDYDAIGLSGTTYDDDVEVIYRASQVTTTSAPELTTSGPSVPASTASKVSSASTSTLNGFVLRVAGMILVQFLY